jgi:hypothetical protein
MQRGMPPWVLPWAVVIIYPGVLLAFDGALNNYHGSGSTFMAVCAMLAMLLATSIPLLVARALLIMREDTGAVLARSMLLLMFTTASLFSLTLRLIRMAGVTERQNALVIWVVAWLAVGLMLFLRKKRSVSPGQERSIKWLRIVHGMTALCLLGGFLIAHVANHHLAAWSVELHDAGLKWLRLWYRSEWVEPALVTLLMVMLGTGVPMVLHYARQRMDAFRVVQAATGVYVGVFILSHGSAVSFARSAGVETDWFFAAGPDSLLDGSPLLARLIPHYMFGTFFLIVHVACGLRIVLLQHGVTRAFADKTLYGLASIGGLATVVITAALLGLHANPPD